MVIVLGHLGTGRLVEVVAAFRQAVKSINGKL